MNNKSKTIDNTRDFLKCTICGNIVGIIENAGPKITCCGKEMQLLKANVVETSKEKHVPVIKISKHQLTVEIGSEPHPMTTEHHITWIAVAQDAMTQRISLENSDVPVAQFSVDNGPITVYAYCNLHGLWMADNPNAVYDEMICSAEFTEGCKKGTKKDS